MLPISISFPIYYNLCLENLRSKLLELVLFPQCVSTACALIDDLGTRLRRRWIVASAHPACLEKALQRSDERTSRQISRLHRHRLATSDLGDIL